MIWRVVRGEVQFQCGLFPGGTMVPSVGCGLGMDPRVEIGQGALGVASLKPVCSPGVCS
jgi:hypothetical protein